MFPVLRLLLPQWDRKRSSYNLKQKLLANIYIRVLCLGKSSKDAQKLINYRYYNCLFLYSLLYVYRYTGQILMYLFFRIPNSSKSGGDISDIIYSIVRKQLSDQKKSLTIDRINIFLDDISEASKMNNSKDELFKDLFRQISPLELKWLTRIILKDLRLGVGTERLFRGLCQYKRNLI